MPTHDDDRPLWGWLARRVAALRALLSGGRRKAGDGAAHRDAPSTRSYGFAGSLTLVSDTAWDDSGGALDSNLRLAISLIEKQDSIQLLERTGLNTDPQFVGQRYLPVHIELNALPDAQTSKYLADQGLIVPDAYFDEAARNDQLRHITARILLKAGIANGDSGDLRSKLRNLVAPANKKAVIKRISLGNMLRACFDGEAFGDIDMPPLRQFNGVTVDGSNIIVGIVDDGCAFAHLDFLKPGTKESRIVYLWDQSAEPKPPGKNWTVPPPGFGYGAELSNNPAGLKAIDVAIAAHVLANGAVDEDAVYRDLGYAMDEDLASHGTHVMGIAAGNGQSSMGFEGIAPKADIIFVQLPAPAIEIGMTALSPFINDAVQYIFARAAMLGKPAVVNISYGGYAGPHDGTSVAEAGIDNLLALPNRAVVVSAGNGFEADCHAHDKVKPSKKSKPLRWVVHPFDPTQNYMQIWYNGNASLDLYLTAPSGQVLGPVHLGAHLNITLGTGTNPPIVGWIDHQTDIHNNDNHIDITLRPTFDEKPPPATVAPAPSGNWTVQVKNVGQHHEANVHAWIEQDDAGRPSGARRRQSRFVTADADAKFSLASLATGQHTIAVGAYNTATHEVCRYSACGPTRPNGVHGPRQKPEVCAPGEDDARGRGVLSASSRKSRATRMNGTSAAAPQVAGLVALMLQYRASQGGGPLTADQIRNKLKAGASRTPLKPNRHNAMDPTRSPNVRQSPVLSEVIGSGRIDISKSL